MQSLQNYLEKMGNNFLVASLIPSLGFVTLSVMIFEPILPPDIRARLGTDLQPIGYSALIILLLTVILGFVFTSLNTFVYKLYEGYIVIWRFPQLRRAQKKKAYEKQREIANLKKKIARLEEYEDVADDDSRLSQHIKNLRGKLDELKTTYQMTFPESEDHILPTPFGNYLKAAENYPRLRYGIDTVPMWPRLIHVIPDSYFAKLDSKNNQLSFLLNCSVLSILFGLQCVIASIYQFALFKLAENNQKFFFYFIPVDLDSNVYQQRILLYLIVFFITLLVSAVFYRACLLIVSEYGDLVKSTFDLFRNELLKQLNQKLPKNSEEEINTWEKLSNFITIGFEKDVKYRPFTYDYRVKSEK
jgi:hypothetical protein